MTYPYKNYIFWFVIGGGKIKRSLILVLLVSVFLSVSALSAADTNADHSAINDSNNQNIENSQAKSVTNIESNSIENKVSNEYETITNVNSSDNEKTITKQTTDNTDTKTATTSKKEITIKSNSITAYAFDTININGNVSYKNGEKLESAKVAIKLNGKTINHTTVSNGVFSAKYELPKFSAKDYNITIVVGETSTSLKATKNTVLTIKRQDIKVSMSDITAASASKVTLRANVTYANGTLANGQKAVFKLNGKTILSTTVVNGVASGSYTVPSAAKSYSLIVKIGQSTISNYKETSSTITVTKLTPTIEKDNIIFVQKGSYVYLHAGITDIGNVKATGKVSFKVDGRTVATVNVINNSADYRYLAEVKYGTHNLSIVYGGSSGLNSVRTNTTLRVQQAAVSTYSYSEILDKANSTHEFILKNNKLPNYVTMKNGNQITMPDLAFMFAEAITFNNSYHNGGFSGPEIQYKSTNYNFNIPKADYVSLANRLINFYLTNGLAPNYMNTVNGEKIGFNETVYTLAKTLSFVGRENYLPNYVTVLKVNNSQSTSGNSGSSSGSSSSYTSSNSVPSGYEKYLVDAKNAQVNSTAIKNAVQKAVSGVSGIYNQAVAIFNYANKVTSYSSYMNTRRGAVKTLQDGLGNCCDQGHLLLSMYRTANIPARYCHATCYFRSGLVIGHVWVECYVNGKWYSCDTTSNQNSFGNIVNWYSSSSVNRYIELYF